LINATDFQDVRTWLVGYEPNTVHKYRLYLQKFCELTKLDPEQLVSLGEQDKRSIRAKLVEFHQYYASNGYSSNTAFNAYMAIRSFFSFNDIRVGKIPPSFKGENQCEGTRIFDRREIFRMLLGARSSRDKAIISFVVQSGQRVGLITKLLYGHVREQIEKSVSPVVIDVASNLSKCRIKYSFAIGKECIDFIRIMMDVRRGEGEPIDDQSILFRTFGLGWKLVAGEWVAGGAIHRRKRGMPLRAESIGPIMRNAAIGGGVPLAKLTPDAKIQGAIRYELHPHAFRRWWKNAMRKGGVNDPLLLDYMLGHGMRYRGVYDGFDQDYIRKEYSKAEPRLTLLSDMSELPAINRASPTQQIVDEPELESLIAKGWRFVATLPSGRIVVQANS
jgi:integrase